MANGVKIDLETALYRVDHGIRLRDSLALARRARAERPSVHGDDVLAWALARNGRCAEALALLEALAPARHAGRDLLLPPRHDRALPRPARRGPQLVRARRRAEPALLASLERRPHGGTRHEATARPRRLPRRAARARRGAGAPARQLHDQPAHRRSSSRAGASTSSTRSTWPRSRPCRRASACARRGFAAEAARGLELRVDGKRAPAPRPRAPHRRAAGRGRPEDAPLRRRLRGTRRPGRQLDVPRPQLRRRGSAGRKSSCSSSDGAELRAASVPATSRSDGLRAYPQDLLRSPLDVTAATASFVARRGQRARRRRSTASRRPSIAAAASRR